MNKLISQAGRVAAAVFVMLFVTNLAMADFDAQQAEGVPWSGYWWPYQKGGLSTGNGYRGQPSPLQKYEMYTEGRQNGPSLQEYNEKYYDPHAPGWYGLCGFWAQAAAYETYEIYPSSQNNIVFRVGDKKGLLTLCHDDNIWEQADGAKPEVFHQWLLNFIKEQKKSFVADMDPTEEVWSYPIYKYAMETKTENSRISVVVNISYADDFVQPDYMGTRVRNKTLTYDLILSGNNIVSGQWTGNSILDHPDKLTYPILPGTSFEALDYQTILDIAKTKDDFLESDAPVSLPPGTYHLVLLNQDAYEIHCLAGESIKMQLTKQTGSAHDISVIVKDVTGFTVAEENVAIGKEMVLELSATRPPYTVLVSQDDYADPNIYSIVLDLQKIYQQSVPYIPKYGMWSGFAITNPWEYSVRGVTLTAYSKNGVPVQTLLGPLQLAAGQKHIFLFENLQWRRHEYNDIDRLVFMADLPVGHLNMIGGGGGDAASCFVQNDSVGYRIVIPDTLSLHMNERSFIGSVDNESFEETDMTISVYSQNGVLEKQVASSLNARDRLAIAPGISPFYTLPDNGWVDVTSTDKDALLSGYGFIKGSDMFDSFFALPVLGSTTKFMPHIPPVGSNWEASITLINTSDSYNTVTLHPRKDSGLSSDVMVALRPFEKQTIDLVPIFAVNTGSDLYRSVLEVAAELSFTGYYTYRRSGMNDIVRYPLYEPDAARQQLILHHNAGKKGYWWTSACIFNSGMDPLTVVMEPYDHKGLQLEGESREFSLAGGAYDVFLMQTAFGIVNAEKISFVKFRVKEGTGRIGGFYMYGAMNHSMIGGASM